MLIKNMPLFFVACSSILISGCGDRKLQTGVFIDSAVENLDYKTDSVDGRTDTGGNFTYLKGETIEFFINDLSFGSSFVGERLSPVDLTPDSTVDSSEVINKAVILQTLDSDDDPSNGIIIPEFAHTISGIAIDFDQTTEAFGNDANALAYIRAAKNDNAAVLVTATDAKAHLVESIGTTSSEETSTVSVSASSVVVTSADEVILTGAVSSRITNFRWEVEEESNITLTLGADSENLTQFQASFIAPTVTETTNYSFQFIGEDASDTEYTATVIIQVDPA